MNWREFIASLVGSLAWPGAVVILVLVLREQIKELLSGPRKRLAVGPFEAEWDRTVEATKNELPLPNQELPKPATERTVACSYRQEGSLATSGP